MLRPFFDWKIGLPPLLLNYIYTKEDKPFILSTPALPGSDHLRVYSQQDQYRPCTPDDVDKGTNKRGIYQIYLNKSERKYLRPKVYDTNKWENQKKEEVGLPISQPDFFVYC